MSTTLQGKLSISMDSMPYFGIPKRVKIFDCQKKEMIAEFDRVRDAARYLGLTNGHVIMIIKNKSKNKTNKLGLIITCR